MIFIIFGAIIQQTMWNVCLNFQPVLPWITIAVTILQKEVKCCAMNFNIQNSKKAKSAHENLIDKKHFSGLD